MNLQIRHLKFNHSSSTRTMNIIRQVILQLTMNIINTKNINKIIIAINQSNNLASLTIVHN